MTRLALQSSCLRVMETFRIHNEYELKEYKTKLCEIAQGSEQFCSHEQDFEFALANGFIVDRSGKGYLNLTEFVNNPFKPEAVFDYDRMTSVVRIAFRMLDNLHINLASHAVMCVEGLADSLLMLGHEYRSIKGRKQAERIVRSLRDEVIDSSIRLAAERGCVTKFDVHNYLMSEWGRSLPMDFREDIKRFGVRCHQHLKIDNRGDVALSFFNGVSPNIVPAMKDRYGWPVKGEDGLMEIVNITNHACRVYQTITGDLAKKPALFSDVTETSMTEIVKMRSAVGKFIDGSILPVDDRVAKFCLRGPQKRKTGTSILSRIRLQA